MRIAVTNSSSNTGFYKFDGRRLKEAIAKLIKINPDIVDMWSYTHIERAESSTVGLYKNVKSLKHLI